MVAVATTHMHLMTVTRLALGLFVLYNLFSWMTAGLRGCASLLLTASNSHHGIPYTYLIHPSLMSAGFSKRHPQIVATPKHVAK